MTCDFYYILLIKLAFLFLKAGPFSWWDLFRAQSNIYNRAFKFFRKKLHHRCLTGFQMRLLITYINMFFIKNYAKTWQLKPHDWFCFFGLKISFVVSYLAKATWTNKFPWKMLYILLYVCIYAIPGYWIYKILIQGFTKQTMFWVYK